MPISPELKAKINALPDEKLKARILDSLNGRRAKNGATDEQIFENVVSSYAEYMAYQARLRKWQESEVIAFIEYFQTQAPELYAKYIAHERDLRENDLRGAEEGELIFDADIRYDIQRLIWDKWLPDPESVDASIHASGLVSAVRNYVKNHLISGRNTP